MQRITKVDTMCHEILWYQNILMMCRIISKSYSYKMMPIISVFEKTAPVITAPQSAWFNFVVAYEFGHVDATSDYQEASLLHTLRTWWMSCQLCLTKYQSKQSDNFYLEDQEIKHESIYLLTMTSLESAFDLDTNPQPPTHPHPPQRHHKPHHRGAEGCQLGVTRMILTTW